jgi:hypothetical protein
VDGQPFDEGLDRPAAVADPTHRAAVGQPVTRRPDPDRRFDTVIDELESLMRRINRTKTGTELDGGTVTDAIARRGVLRTSARYDHGSV